MYYLIQRLFVFLSITWQLQQKLKYLIISTKIQYVLWIDYVDLMNVLVIVKTVFYYHIKSHQKSDASM